MGMSMHTLSPRPYLIVMPLAVFFLTIHTPTMITL